MTATTFTTQRQLMRKNMPESALTGQYAQQQKLLLYVLPVVFAVGGIAFPIGVLLYWTTSNLWTMGQQFYVIRNNPTPGTPAFEAKKQRDRRSRPKRTRRSAALTTRTRRAPGQACRPRAEPPPAPNSRRSNPGASASEVISELSARACMEERDMTDQTDAPAESESTPDEAADQAI